MTKHEQLVPIMRLKGSFEILTFDLENGSLLK